MPASLQRAANVDGEPNVGVVALRQSWSNPPTSADYGVIRQAFVFDPAAPQWFSQSNLLIMRIGT